MLSPLHGIIGVVMLLTSSHDDGVRQARAHTHGVGEAVISIESEGVFIEIIAPAANFTSAEYGSDFDNLMLENIALFPERAGCTLSSLDVERKVKTTILMRRTTTMMKTMITTNTLMTVRRIRTIW